MVEEGTCWVHGGDQRLVEVTEVKRGWVDFVVLAPGMAGDGEMEGRARTSEFQESFSMIRDELAEMRELYEVGQMSVREIGSKYGFSSYTAYHRLKDAGTVFRKGGARKGVIYDRTRRKIGNLIEVRDGLAAGKTARQLAAETGLSRSRIYQLMRELDEGVDYDLDAEA